MLINVMLWVVEKNWSQTAKTLEEKHKQKVKNRPRDNEGLLEWEYCHSVEVECDGLPSNGKAVTVKRK